VRPEIDCTLYLVTDRDLMSTATLEDAVDLAVTGGATLVQLREKTASSLNFYRTAMNIRQITDRHNVPLIINDRVDIALAADAAGVHLGQSDLPVRAVRSITGKDKIIGVSVSSAEEALRAQKDGADYLGVGAMFATGTKKNAEHVTMNELKNIRSAVKIPIVVIGGISRKNISCFEETGINGVAVVSALISSHDIASEATELKKLSLHIQEDHHAEV